ncbi:MAG: ATP-binding protein [Bacteroidota bacterium]
MKEKIKEIITVNQSRDFGHLIKRDIAVSLFSNKILSVVGPRRAGKTHILYLLIQQAYAQGIKKEQIILINFEDERLISDDFSFDLILQAYQELFPQFSLHECFFFFDEIQNFLYWEKFVRRLYDDHTKNIVVTGSNASFLSTDIATSLRGRALAIEVLPLSFQEFLSFKGIEPNSYSATGKALAINAFREYLTQGGFPELVKMDMPLKKKVLQEYFNVMIYRDLVERFQISQTLLLKYFIKKIFLSVGKPLSINKIYNDFRSNKYSVGKNTLYDFLGYVKDAYVITTIDKFDFSEMKRENTEKKAYATDWGLLSAVEYSSSEDFGKLFENLVVLEFKKLQHKIYFFKQLKECDLVVEIVSSTLIPVQVMYKSKKGDTLNRELAGLKEASDFLKADHGIIITMDQEEELRYKNLSIKMIPAYKFFSLKRQQQENFLSSKLPVSD